MCTAPRIGCANGANSGRPRQQLHQLAAAEGEAEPLAAARAARDAVVADGRVGERKMQHATIIMGERRCHPRSSTRTSTCFRRASSTPSGAGSIATRGTFDTGCTPTTCSRTSATTASPAPSASATRTSPTWRATSTASWPSSAAPIPISSSRSAPSCRASPTPSPSSTKRCASACAASRSTATCRSSAPTTRASIRSTRAPPPPRCAGRHPRRPPAVPRRLRRRHLRPLLGRRHPPRARAPPPLTMVVPHLGDDEEADYFAMLGEFPNLHLDTTMMLGGYFERRIDPALLEQHADRISTAPTSPTSPTSGIASCAGSNATSLRPRGKRFAPATRRSCFNSRQRPFVVGNSDSG